MMPRRRHVWLGCLLGILSKAATAGIRALYALINATDPKRYSARKMPHDNTRYPLLRRCLPTLPCRSRQTGTHGRHLPELAGHSSFARRCQPTQQDGNAGAPAPSPGKRGMADGHGGEYSSLATHTSVVVLESTRPAADSVVQLWGLRAVAEVATVATAAQRSATQREAKRKTHSDTVPLPQRVRHAGTPPPPA